MAWPQIKGIAPADQRGVTLVEVMISMAIILIVGLACVQVLQFNSRASLSTLKRIQASQYLDQIRNHLRRSNIAALESRYRKFPQIITTGDYSAEAAIQPPADDQSRQATITVRWNFNQSENSISEDVTLVPK